jgi:predicted site-specific integrase-resolvase
MKPNELVNHFGSITKAAAGIDVSSQTVLNWIEKGVIPYNAQKAIAYDTKGKLKPDAAEIGKGM